MSANFFRTISRLIRQRSRKATPLRNPASKADRRSAKMLLEILEDRVQPSATLVSAALGGTSTTRIVGTVYEDANKDGVKNNGENGVSGWTVYLDLDQSGTLNTDAVGVMEPSAITDKDGNFSISRLTPGLYRLGEVVQAGWTPTAPAFQDVSVIKDKDNKANFFNFSGGTIVGTVWNDFNQNSVRDTDPVSGAFVEQGLAGWTVFLDANNNRLLDAGEPSTVTDAEGRYAFSDLPPNDYEVTELTPDGWDVSPKFDTRQTAAVAARMQTTIEFANYSLVSGSIDGTVWNDQNADGVRNVDPATGAFTEPGLAGWTVFVDANNNGVPDTGELTTVTDDNGHYAFISLAAGDYEVTEVLPDGWSPALGFDVRQTVAVHAGGATTAPDFANFTVMNGMIRGTVWNDLNRNGVRDTNLAGAYTDPGLANWLVFLDKNRNGLADVGEPTALTDATGSYTFPDLQVGDYEVREVLPAGWETSTGFSDSVGVTVYSGTDVVAPDFANFNLSTAIPGSVSGTVWNDLNSNGVRDTDATGAFLEPGLAGWTVFVDANMNGALDASETAVTTAADGSYSITGVLPGSVTVIEQVPAGWRATHPISGVLSFSLKNGENASGLDLGNWALQEAAIRGVVFADVNKDGVRATDEKGLADISVYLDLNNNGQLDAGEPRTTTSGDQFFTPGVDETGTYSFTHLAAGAYTVRMALPATLSATPADQLIHQVTIAGSENHSGIDCAAVYRPTEIHGERFDDTNGNHQRDAGEAPTANATVFVDLNRNNLLDAGEPTSVTGADGSYAFSGLAPGAYVIRESLGAGYQATYPNNTGGILWPTGTSNAAVGNVTPTSITASLAVGESYRQTVSLTMPTGGALTNMVDVFLLFDDTGSFTNNSPIVRAAFPNIISQLQTSLPGLDLGFGVGRFEEYANYAWEYSTGRPFILNQPIVATSTAGYMTAIQAALDRTTPGYGGDQPETDIEALYQLVTGLGFDGNNNGSVLDSGAAGLASTQLNPGGSGDVPSFASFQADSANNVLPAAGNVGGGGFRPGALPIILTATDTGFAYQPKGETVITGASGVSVPISALTETSRPDTPYNSGAGIQQTVTALNALGALVIGLGTNTETNLDPRQGLESLSKLTGAVNRSGVNIDNGTGAPIAPGDPLYFQIASGFASSVANGVVNAIQNAVTSVAVDVTIQASDPRVKIINHTGVRSSIGAGQTASFDIEFVGDGVPHRFDLQFVRAGTNVILGSIPVVLGTPIPGDCYEFEDLDPGEIQTHVDFGSQLATTTVTTPTINLAPVSVGYDGAVHSVTATATSAGSAVPGSFTFTYNGQSTPPALAGVYQVIATFTSADPAYGPASATTTLTITPATPTLTVVGGIFTADGAAHSAAVTATGIAGVSITGVVTVTYNGLATPPSTPGVYDVQVAFVSSDANYANAVASNTITINKAVQEQPTIQWNGLSYVYDGNSHGVSAQAINGVGQVVSGAFVFTYNGAATLPIAVGDYDVVASFTSNDPLYANAQATSRLTIVATKPTLFVSGGTYPYDGARHAATFQATGVGGGPVPGSFVVTYNGSATAPSDAGVYNVVATFTSADGNYTGSAQSATITINAFAPSLVVSGGLFAYDGKAHAASALVIGVGGSGVPGSLSFTYNGSASVPVAAGVYNVAATFTSADGNYTGTAGAATLTISAASPTLSVSGGNFAYDGVSHAALATATGITGLGISGSFTLTYNGGTLLPLNAGSYSVVANFVSTDPNYSGGTASNTLTISQAAPTFSSLAAPTITQGTASVLLTGHLAAGTVIPRGVSVQATLNGVSQNGNVDSNGNFSIALSSTALSAGAYPIVIHSAGDGLNFAAADGSTTLMVNAVVNTISAQGVNVGATAGAPVTATVATLVNSLGSASAYAATIQWGDGSTSVGTILSSGASLIVSGNHTYADPGSATIRVSITDTKGLGLSTVTTSVATIANLNVAAGKTKEAEFWQTKPGQALLTSFNGGASQKQLGNWLALNFPNLYGANAGAKSLAGKSNADIADLYKALWKSVGDGAATQVLTAALNVYATTSSLGGSQGAAYGFVVSSTGFGARLFSTACYGAAVGAANNTKLNVFQLLRGVDKQAKLGVLYAGNTSLQSQAKSLFSRLNSI